MDKDNFITKVVLDEKEIKALARLNGNKDFEVLKKVIEQKLIQAEAFNLLIPMPNPQDDLQNLHSTQGGYWLWQKIEQIIDLASTKLIKLKEIKENENNK